MSVVKGKRKLSRYEAQHNFFKLRAEVTQLMMNDFGFSEKKYRQFIEKYKNSHKESPNVDELVIRWETRCEAFKKWFINKEQDAVLELLRKIEVEFTIGISIFPSATPAKIMEFIMRRRHIDNAIGYCYALKQEMNYIIRTLPVDLNKYKQFAKKIDRQIELYKIVRTADNKLIKPSDDAAMDEDIKQVFEGIASLIYKASEIESSC